MCDGFDQIFSIILELDEKLHAKEIEVTELELMYQDAKDAAESYAAECVEVEKPIRIFLEDYDV